MQNTLEEEGKQQHNFIFLQHKQDTVEQQQQQHHHRLLQHIQDTVDQQQQQHHPKLLTHTEYSTRRKTTISSQTITTQILQNNNIKKR